MIRTREDFCRDLLDGDSVPHEPLDPERLAARFVRFFRLSGHPDMGDLKVMLREAGFGEVRQWEMDGLKGAHIGRPRGHYDIYYRQGLWDGSSTYTVLHETCEIIHETLCDMQSDSPPERKVCREADRFAAAVLMQPGAFGPMASRSGLDVLVLQRAFHCSYAAVTLRLAEVVRDLPLMSVLYEREERGDPAGWTDPPSLRATVVRRTGGFGTQDSFPISGEQSGLPRRGMTPAPGSMADRAIRYGRSQYSIEDGMAVIARPLHWKGRLAKVVVVAVHSRDFAVLGPQLLASDAGCRRRALAAVPW